MSKLSLLTSADSKGSKLFSDDVFQSFTRTGTGADVVVTTGIDMTKGYMLWSKGRSGTTDHAIYDSARGVTLDLASNTTATQTTQSTGLKAVSATGHTIGSLAKMNTSAATYVDFVFRQSPKFFLNTTVTKSSGSNATVDLSSLGTVGMVMVKRTDAAGSWYVFHRSATTGKLLYLEQTAAEATLGHITVSGTTLTLVNGVIADGSYVVYAWAHDNSADGIIQCGSFTTDGSGNASVNLGWEPQYVLMKRASGGTSSWYLLDTARGLPVGSSDNYLFADQSMAEGSLDVLALAATGFSALNAGASMTWTYMAIRRSNKPPTLGTQVYNAVARTGTGVAATVTGVGFAPDLVMSKVRNGGGHGAAFDRLRGALPRLYPSAAASESSAYSDQVTSFDQDGMSVGPDASALSVNAITPYIYHFFKRAPGVFSILCDTGTAVNKLENHNLGSIPELMIRKGRSGATQWEVYFSSLGNTKKLVLNSTAAEATDTTAWNSTSPTATQVSIGTGTNVNTTAATYVTYLMSSLTGISKVGTYTGNGTTQTVDMGFTTGCRFFLVKASSTTGSWWVFDSVRGIVASTDFGLQLNSTAAEVTSADAVDPATVGIAVVQEATCSLNANGVIYQYWAMA